jgi:hypothetical protein
MLRHHNALRKQKTGSAILLTALESKIKTAHQTGVVVLMKALL